MGRPPEARQQQEMTTWYIHAYLHADQDDVHPIDEAALDGLQFGGRRNYGYGMTQLKETQTVDLDKLDYSRLEDGETYLLELVPPVRLGVGVPGGVRPDGPMVVGGESA